ncbi:hypothetical protein LXL04_017676 [Taraxacum kok-saghyz]
MIRAQICRSNKQWCALISVTLFAVAFVAAVSYASNRLSLLSLPFSPWPWRWPPSSSSSSFSIRSFNLDHPTPPPLNPKTALYSMFHCDSDACKKQNGKMNKVVSKLIKELKDETLLRNSKNKRDRKLEKVEAELGRARVLIRDAGINLSCPSSRLNDRDYVPDGSIYRNPYMFHRYVFF